MRSLWELGVLGERKGQICQVVVVSPKPPPVHGAAIAVGELMKSPLVERFGIGHIDARFTGEVADLQRFRIGKLRRLVSVLWAIRRVVRGAGANVVVLTPTFLPKPFLKDAALIWWTSLHRPREILAWFHMDFATMGYDRRSPLFRWFVRATLLRCTRAVCVAPGLEARLPDFLRVRPVEVAPNGVADAFGANPTRRPEGGAVRVIFLSHMGIDKGWELLFREAELLCAQFPALEFRFYGGPTADSSAVRIEEWFARGRFPGRIRWEGFVEGEAKRTAMLAAHIFCFPSFNEAFPLTVLEAMSAGLPIVATRVGAVPDALIDEEGGYLVEPREGASLRAALERLVADGPARSRMGAFNRKRYEEKFTVERYLAAWDDVLRRVAGGQGDVAA